MERKHVLQTNGTFKQDLFNKTVNASTMSVFYQVPQYILQGVSEVLVGVTGNSPHLYLEFQLYRILIVNLQSGSNK